MFVTFWRLYDSPPPCSSLPRLGLRLVAVLTSEIDRGADEFARQRVRMGISSPSCANARRKWSATRRVASSPARERIDRLIDPGTAFLELNALAAWDLYDGGAPSAGAR